MTNQFLCCSPKRFIFLKPDRRIWKSVSVPTYLDFLENNDPRKKKSLGSV